MIKLFLLFLFIYICLYENNEGFATTTEEEKEFDLNFCNGPEPYTIQKATIDGDCYKCMGSYDFTIPDPPETKKMTDEEKKKEKIVDCYIFNGENENCGTENVKKCNLNYISKHIIRSNYNKIKEKIKSIEDKEEKSPEDGAKLVAYKTQEEAFKKILNANSGSIFERAYGMLVQFDEDTGEILMLGHHIVYCFIISIVGIIACVVCMKMSGGNKGKSGGNDDGGEDDSD